MDITEDSNTNSKNKLTLANNNEETLHSQESDPQLPPGGPAYALFYHGGPQPEVLGRFNSKKNLTSKN